MRMEIVGIADGKKIQAIKGLRWITKMSLKEAKDVIDGVAGGTPYQINVTDNERQVLEEHYCITQSVVGISVDELILSLEEFPANMRVGDLRKTLQAVARMTHE